MRRTRAKLKLYRETIRALSTRELAGVAGAAPEGLGEIDTGPKTNGWTGRVGIDEPQVCTRSGG